jgi:hypothetical protein
LGRGVWWKVQNTRLRKNAKGKFYVQKVHGGLDKTGVADINGCYNGLYIAIEVKAPKGTQNPSQIAFEGLIKQNGGIYIVARSVDDVIAALSEIAHQT